MRQAKEVYRKTRRRIVVGFLALVVAASTAITMIIPALTLEGDPELMAAESVSSVTPVALATPTGIPAESTPSAAISEEGISLETESVSEETAVSATATDSILTPAVETDLPKVDIVSRRAARLASAPGTEAANTKLLTVAGVQLEGAQLAAGQFTFYLYDHGVKIAEAKNDAVGNITFPIPIRNTGVYTYTICQVSGDDPGITYDTNQHTVTVAVEDGNVVSPEFNSDIYYGLNTMSGTTYLDMVYRFYMSPTVGGTDYRVLCIDHSAKPAPTSAGTQVYWVAEVDPSEEMLRSCVCNRNGYSGNTYYSAYDGWCNDLTVNLKKLLYATIYGDYSGLNDLSVQTLAWQMTQGKSSVTSVNAGYIQDILRDTVVPAGYRLVLFHPSDGSYQSFAALLPSTRLQNIRSDSVLFKNTYTPSETMGTKVTIQAQKKLDGKAPGDRRFRFQLIDANGNVLQTKENDAAGTIAFDPISYTKMGTYSYTIREVNDGQAGITYDKKAIDVTVNVQSESSGLDGKTVYGDELIAGTYDDYYYILDQGTGEKYHVYCLNNQKAAPDGLYYHAQDDAPDQAIAGATVKGNVANIDKIKRVLYYFRLYPNAYNNFYQQMIVWQATGQSVLMDEYLSAILRKVPSVPDNFHIVYFETAQSGYQNLIMGYLSPEPEITYKTSAEYGSTCFENTTATHAGYELPSTGGAGTSFVTSMGLLCMVGATSAYVFRNKQRIGGTTKPDNR